jgi:hypothetical protein
MQSPTMAPAMSISNGHGARVARMQIAVYALPVRYCLTAGLHPAASAANAAAVPVVGV